MRARLLYGPRRPLVAGRINFLKAVEEGDLRLALERLSSARWADRELLVTRLVCRLTETDVWSSAERQRSGRLLAGRLDRLRPQSYLGDFSTVASSREVARRLAPEEKEAGPLWRWLWHKQQAEVLAAIARQEKLGQRGQLLIDAMSPRTHPFWRCALAKMLIDPGPQAPFGQSGNRSLSAYGAILRRWQLLLGNHLDSDRQPISAPTFDKHLEQTMTEVLLAGMDVDEARVFLIIKVQKIGESALAAGLTRVLSQPGALSIFSGNDPDLRRSAHRDGSFVVPRRELLAAALISGTALFNDGDVRAAISEDRRRIALLLK